VLIEPCEIVAVAEGASGFIESASFGRDATGSQPAQEHASGAGRGVDLQG
jgi:hypothetical protein